MCNLRGETSETPLNISERVRMFSGVPLLVSNFWELQIYYEYRFLSLNFYHICFQSCPRPRTALNNGTEDQEFVCCKDAKYKDPWPDA